MDVTDPVHTLNPSSSEREAFTYVDLSAVNNRTKSVENPSVISTTGAPSRARQVLVTGDVLVSTVRPNLNAVALVPPSLNGSIASTGFTVLRASERDLDHRYLFHWVQAPAFVKKMVSMATGASYPAISDRIVKSSVIPCPALVEQRRIADILDKADALRAKRREAIAHLDSLGQSIFHEMFDETNGTTVRLDEVATVQSGITKGRKVAASAVLKEHPYMAVSNVQDMSLKLDAVRTIAVTQEEVSRYSLQVYDLLMTEGGDPDKLGRGTLWTGEIDPCLHQNHIYRVRIKPHVDVLPVYLNWVTAAGSAKDYFLRCAKQTTGIASINKTQLSATPIPVPPINLQRTFEDRINAVDTLRVRYRAQLAELDTLFLALQDRAFKGEL